MPTLRLNDLTPERRQVLALHKQGLPIRRIAKALDVSTQRIYQQIDALEKAGFIQTKKDAS